MSACDQVLARVVRPSAPRIGKGPHLRGARSHGRSRGRERAELFELAGEGIERIGRMIIQPGLTLVFDMDGVILDSNPTHREAWAAYNRRFGIQTGEAMQQRMYGKRNDEIVRDFFGSGLTPEEVLAHGAAKEGLFRQMMAPRLTASLVAGVTRFLQNRNGAPAGLATNAERANVDFVLDGLGLRSCFQAVVDGHQVSRPKPHP